MSFAWGDIVRTPNGEIGECRESFTLDPDNVEVIQVTVDCLYSVWRARDLTPATPEEVAQWRETAVR